MSTQSIDPPNFLDSIPPPSGWKLKVLKIIAGALMIGAVSAIFIAGFYAFNG